MCRASLSAQVLGGSFFIPAEQMNDSPVHTFIAQLDKRSNRRPGVHFQNPGLQVIAHRDVHAKFIYYGIRLLELPADSSAQTE
jgi:hypothetical protein